LFHFAITPTPKTDGVPAVGDVLFGLSLTINVVGSLVNAVNALFLTLVDNQSESPCVYVRLVNAGIPLSVLKSNVLFSKKLIRTSTCQLVIPR